MFYSIDEKNLHQGEVRIYPDVKTVEDYNINEASETINKIDDRGLDKYLNSDARSRIRDRKDFIGSIVTSIMVISIIIAVVGAVLYGVSLIDFSKKEPQLECKVYQNHFGIKFRHCEYK